MWSARKYIPKLLPTIDELVELAKNLPFLQLLQETVLDDVLKPFLERLESTNEVCCCEEAALVDEGPCCLDEQGGDRSLVMPQCHGDAFPVRKSKFHVVEASQLLEEQEQVESFESAGAV